jgi:hypothetical protein
MESKKIEQKDCPHCGRCPVCGRREAETPYCPCYPYYHYPWHPYPYTTNPWDTGTTWTITTSDVWDGTSISDTSGYITFSS